MNADFRADFDGSIERERLFGLDDGSSSVLSDVDFNLMVGYLCLCHEQISYLHLEKKCCIHCAKQLHADEMNVVHRAKKRESVSLV